MKMKVETIEMKRQYVARDQSFTAQWKDSILSIYDTYTGYVFCERRMACYTDAASFVRTVAVHVTTGGTLGNYQW